MEVEKEALAFAIENVNAKGLIPNRPLGFMCLASMRSETRMN